MFFTSGPANDEASLGHENCQDWLEMVEAVLGLGVKLYLSIMFQIPSSLSCLTVQQDIDLYFFLLWFMGFFDA